MFSDGIQKKKFNLQDQKSIGVKVQEKKRKYEEDKKNPAIKKAVWNAKWIKWVYPFTQRGYIQPRVRKVFKDSTDEPSDSVIRAAPPPPSPPRPKKKKKAIEVQYALFLIILLTLDKKLLRYNMLYFDYFIDIRYSLKGRLPQHILFCKTKQLYEE